MALGTKKREKKIILRVIVFSAFINGNFFNVNFFGKII